MRRDLFAAGAFCAGLLTAALLLSTDEAESTVSAAALRQNIERNGERGEIARALRQITDRVAAARVPSTRITGNLTIRLGNVIWNDGPRRPFLRAARVQGTLDIGAAERGDIIIDGLVFTDARVLLDQQTAGGQWNYERVLAELFDDEPDDGEPDPTIELRNVRLVDSRVDLHQPARDLVFDQLAVSAPRIQLSAPRTDVPELDIARLTTVYVDVRKNERLPLHAEQARLRIPDGDVDFEIARATVGTTQLSSLDGIWNPGGPGLGVTVSGRALDVALEELAFIHERLPRSGRASFTFAVAPRGENALDVSLSRADIRTQGSQITGAASFNTEGDALEIDALDLRLEPLTLALVEQVSGRKLPYGGSLSGTVRGSAGSVHFDVVTALTAAGVTRPIETRLDGEARYAGGVLALQRVQAELRAVPAEALRPIASGLPFSGNINGTVTLTGPPERAPLTLAVRLEMAGGTALVNGTLDLTGAVAAYDLNGSLLTVSLAQLLEPRVPPVDLTARFALRGRGFDPAQMDARVELAGAFTGWRTQPRDTLKLAATVRGGAVLLDTGVVNMGPIHLDARGQWRFVAPETGALSYRLAIDNLGPVAPFLPAFPDSASGVLASVGTVSGSLERMRVEGKLTGEDVRVLRWSARSLETRHTVVLGDSMPEIHVEGTASGIDTPAGAYDSATLDVRLDAPVFALEVRAERETGGPAEIVASGHIPFEGARRIVLQRARLDLGEAQWALLAPATIDWGAPGGGVNVSNFDLREAEGTGRLSIDGRVLPLAQVDARVEATSLPLAAVQTMLGRQPDLTGDLNLTAELRGPGEAPTFRLEFHVDSGSYERIPFSGLQGKLEYRGTAIVAEAQLSFDTANKVELRANLPAHIALAPVADFDLLDSGPVSGTLVADDLSLTMLQNAFPELQDLTGGLRANATLSGTVGAPVLAGNIQLFNGAATVLPLDRRYEDITAEVAFTQRTAEIKSLRARSDGWFEANGQIDFPSIKNPVAAISARLENFRVAGVENRQDAAATGELTLTGPLLAPTIRGHVTLDDGDLPVPRFGGSPLDAELAELGEPPTVWDPNASVGGGLYDNLIIDDLRITASDGLWFSMQNARAQLSGTLTINKSGDNLRMDGTLEGERGTYTLEAGPILRRFEIVHAEVRFTGGDKINPALDITARRVVTDPSGRELDIQVRVTGTIETPRLGLASQDAAQIPESELLSFLIFGQPTLGLGGSGLPGVGAVPGFGLFEETYLSGLAELASLELENALGGPFDILQIRLGTGELGGLRSSTLVLGRELTDELFLTVESGIAALFGPGETTANLWAVRLEWRINPHTSLRLGYEPANRSSLIRGLGVALPVNRQQQAAIELRRRWSW